MKRTFPVFSAGVILISLAAFPVSGAVEVACDHPAARYFEQCLAGLSLKTEQLPDIRIEAPSSGPYEGEWYEAWKENGKIVIKGARPRALLYAAGEPAKWIALKEGEKVRREPAFAHRMLNFTGRRHSVAEWVAATGANSVQLARRAKASMVDACREADVECYAFLYGCDAMKWNRGACEAFLADHPECKAQDPGRSWEKGILCPSAPATWEFCAGVIRALAESAPYDGVAVTFWDDYGLNCHCKRCKANGMDKFSSQIAALVKCFEGALAPLGKKLLVRTWSSGCPHWLGSEWVHAPGYGGVGGEPLELWGETYRTASKDTIIQTKVYNSDCQPRPPFSRLLGEAKKAGFTEYAEWQITGQTVGLGWLPASVVDDTAWRMKKARELVGGECGVCLYAGGYNNRDYEALDDIMNSINIYAWRQLSWNPDEDVDAIWEEWSRPRYGKGAGDMTAALKLSEKASAVSFSPLGLGAPTESRFAGSMGRREDLLRYTNRTSAPECGALLLASTMENINRVVTEKDEALADVESMKAHIAAAASAEQDHPWLEEVQIRTEWLKTHLICSRALDGALWRCHYLQWLCSCAQSDARLMREIEADFDTIRANHKKLFEHSPDLQLSFYDTPCGDREITLRSPIPLMRDIHSNALECVEKIMGPEWKEL